jgi:hypothetical protein
MMKRFNFNIHNYSINEIQSFFKLNDISNYTSTELLIELNSKEQIIKNKIHDSELPQNTKLKIYNFLENAKNILLSCKQNEELFNQDNYQNVNNYPITSNVSKINNSNKNIIEHPERLFLHTDNSEYYDGKINPLNKRIISNYVLIDSKFRENYEITTSSNFIVNLPTKLNNVVSMQLSSFEIPISFYGISDTYGNNTFQMIIHYIDNEIETSETKIIVVPDGNYNPNFFIETINNLISPRDVNGVPINSEDIFGYILAKVDLLDDYSGTGRVTFTTSGSKENLIKTFEIKFIKPFNCNDINLPLSSRIGYNLGFIKEEYKDKKTYISEMIIEPATIRYFYLAVDDYNNNVNTQFITVYKDSTTLTSSILAKISARGSYFSLMMENDVNITSEPRTYFGPVNIQKLQIYLLDDHGRLLDMTQGNFSFTLLIKRIYDL